MNFEETSVADPILAKFGSRGRNFIHIFFRILFYLFLFFHFFIFFPYRFIFSGNFREIS